MSEEFVPSVDMLRSAWRLSMTGEVAPDAEADASFDRWLDVFGKWQQAVGYMASQEAMQATIDGSIQEVQAQAWEEGWEAAIDQAPADTWFDEWHCQANPYGRTVSE